MALGHHMMTCGLGSEQYFWCNLCCAYTGDRVRKLAKECDRVSRTVVAVHKLRESLHPIRGTPMTTKARRLLKVDVGGMLGLVDPMVTVSDASSDSGCDDHRLIVADVLSRPQHSPLED